MMKRIAAAMFAVALVGSAAASAASIDFSAVLTDQDGNPISDCVRWDGAAQPPRCLAEVPMTLGRIAANGLNAQEPNLTPQQTVARGMLALRVYQAKGPIEIEAADVDLIKTMIVKAGYRPLVVVAAFKLLDPASVKGRTP